MPDANRKSKILLFVSLAVSVTISFINALLIIAGLFGLFVAISMFSTPHLEMTLQALVIILAITFVLLIPIILWVFALVFFKKNNDLLSKAFSIISMCTTLIPLVAFLIFGAYWGSMNDVDNIPIEDPGYYYDQTTDIMN